MPRIDPALRIQDDDPLDQIPQFPHIPGPMVILQHRQRLRCPVLWLAPLCQREFLQKKSGQRRNILFAFAQRRDVKRNHVQPVE